MVFCVEEASSVEIKYWIDYAHIYRYEKEKSGHERELVSKIFGY